MKPVPSVLHHKDGSDMGEMMKASRMLYLSFCIVPLAASFAAADDTATAPAPVAGAVVTHDHTAAAPGDAAVDGAATDCIECDDCCTGRLWGRRGCRDRCRMCWTTTGDMHPHYAYYPSHHGYYYYRPYNYVHVLEHQYQALALGGDPRAPYHNRQFERVYERHAAARYEETDAATYYIPLLHRASRPLPDIQDILETAP